MRALFASLFMLLAAPAVAHEPTAYAPMTPFAKLAGHTLRGVSQGPEGNELIDIARWEFILGGKALQSTHRIQDSNYGGRTIFFWDEGAEEYVFHYFTTAGFHTTGTAEVIENGFVSIEEVHGDKRYKEVRSVMTFVSDEVVRVESDYVKHDGELVEGPRFTYTVVDAPGPKFH